LSPGHLKFLLGIFFVYPPAILMGPGWLVRRFERFSGFTSPGCSFFDAVAFFPPKPGTYDRVPVYLGDVAALRSTPRPEGLAASRRPLFTPPSLPSHPGAVRFLFPHELDVLFTDAEFYFFSDFFPNFGDAGGAPPRCSLPSLQETPYAPRNGCLTLFPCISTFFSRFLSVDVFFLTLCPQFPSSPALFLALFLFKRDEKDVFI